MGGNLHSIEQFKADLRALGLKEGDTVMVHSSYKSLGGIEEGPAGVFKGLLEVLGEEGTLIFPGFSFDTVTRENPVFDIDETPSCVGFLPEYFRTKVEGVIRSIHATHSLCLKGKRAEELASGHEKDLTPVGENSPLTKLPKIDGKILMLGNGAGSNTSMHGVEELSEPPYLFDRTKPVEYTLKIGEKVIKQQGAIRHNFVVNGKHLGQRYAKIIELLDDNEYTYAKVLDANCYLFSAKAVWEKGHKKLLEDPYYFVEEE